MARTCILHVGTEKTGSTSIQRFMGLNRAALKQSRAYVPDSLAPHSDDGFFNHIALTVVSRPDLDELHDVDMLMGLRDISDHKEFVSKSRRNLAEELSTIDDDVKIILSNEHIHSRVCTPKRLEYLRDFLSPFFGDIVVVVYLRSQYEMARSLINTALRQGQVVTKPVPDFSQGWGYDPELPVEACYFDLKRFLFGLAGVFGMSALRVRLYPEGRPTSELISDFCCAAGLSVDAPTQPPRENASFSRPATLLLQKVNEIRARGEQAIPLLSQHLSEYLGCQHPGRGLVASRSQIEDFMAAYADDNELIRQRWFPARKTLFQANGDHGEDASAPLDAQQAVELMVEFVSWLDQTRPDPGAVRQALQS
jgi:hypothetical protein